MEKSKVKKESFFVSLSLPERVPSDEAQEFNVESSDGKIIKVEWSPKKAASVRLLLNIDLRYLNVLIDYLKQQGYHL